MRTRRVGAKVRMNNIALENYGEQYRGKTFVISHVATNRSEHPGYDESSGCALYDLTLDGKDFPCSLYEWEIISA